MCSRGSCLWTGKGCSCVGEWGAGSFLFAKAAALSQKARLEVRPACSMPFVSWLDVLWCAGVVLLHVADTLGCAWSAALLAPSVCVLVPALEAECKHITVHLGDCCLHTLYPRTCCRAGARLHVSMQQATPYYICVCVWRQCTNARRGLSHHYARRAWLPFSYLPPLAWYLAVHADTWVSKAAASWPACHAALIKHSAGRHSPDILQG